MADCEYWKRILSKLSIPADRNWAAHVLNSDEENLSEARKCVCDDGIIAAVISAYGDGDWLTQSYCDGILTKFERKSVERICNQMTVKNDNVRRSVERLLTL